MCAGAVSRRGSMLSGRPATCNGTVGQMPTNCLLDSSPHTSRSNQRALDDDEYSNLLGRWEASETLVAASASACWAGSEGAVATEPSLASVVLSSSFGCPPHPEGLTGQGQCLAWFPARCAHRAAKSACPKLWKCCPVASSSALCTLRLFVQCCARWWTSPSSSARALCRTTRMAAAATAATTCRLPCAPTAAPTAAATSRSSNDAVASPSIIICLLTPQGDRAILSRRLEPKWLGGRW